MCCVGKVDEVCLILLSLPHAFRITPSLLTKSAALVELRFAILYSIHNADHASVCWFRHHAAVAGHRGPGADQDGHAASNGHECGGYLGYMRRLFAYDPAFQLYNHSIEGRFSHVQVIAGLFYNPLLLLTTLQNTHSQGRPHATTSAHCRRRDTAVEIHGALVFVNRLVQGSAQPQAGYPCPVSAAVSAARCSSTTRSAR